MNLPDVNILIYAHNKTAPDHARYAAWLKSAIDGADPFGICDLALSGFVRIVTNPKFSTPPTPSELALKFVESLRSHPNARDIAPGPNHWKIFVDLCRKTNARGNGVPDAYYAALAIESGCEWISADRGFAKYPGQRWRHPFA